MITQQQIDEYLERHRPEIIVAVRTFLLDAGHVGMRYYYRDGKQVSDAHNCVRTSAIATAVLLKFPELAPRIPAKEDEYYDPVKALGLWLQQQVADKQRPFVDWGEKVGGVDPMKNATWSEYEWLFPMDVTDPRHPKASKKQK